MCSCTRFSAEGVTGTVVASRIPRLRTVWDIPIESLEELSQPEINEAWAEEAERRDEAMNPSKSCGG